MFMCSLFYFLRPWHGNIPLEFVLYPFLAIMNRYIYTRFHICTNYLFYISIYLLKCLCSITQIVWHSFAVYSGVLWGKGIVGYSKFFVVNSLLLDEYEYDDLVVFNKPPDTSQVQKS